VDIFLSDIQLNYVEISSAILKCLSHNHSFYSFQSLLKWINLERGFFVKCIA